MTRLPARLLAGLLGGIGLANLAIVVAWRYQAAAASVRPPPGPGLAAVRVVDERLWRGPRPSWPDCAEMAAGGVTTVVDLRSPDEAQVDEAQLASLGLGLVRIPLRDGQAPSAGQVARFLHAVATSPGTTFVHCGGGVGRTGTMVAAYRVAGGTATARVVLRENLAVGPPTLEQLAFTWGLDGGVRAPSLWVVAVSRLLDAPRRGWARLRRRLRRRGP
ncbi:MAG: protein-tyrosine phosphatase family protein [Acidimicrobiales bacterium]